MALGGGEAGFLSYICHFGGSGILQLIPVPLRKEEVFFFFFFVLLFQDDDWLKDRVLWVTERKDGFGEKWKVSADKTSDVTGGNI